MKRLWPLFLLSLGSLLACGGDERPTMLPGHDCLSCHSGAAAHALGAPVWTAAGTVYGDPDAEMNAGKEGVLVHLTDARNVSLTLHTNASGNFYTAESLEFPLRACVEADGQTHCMQTVPRGSCNECHTIPSTNQAPGRITAP